MLICHQATGTGTRRLTDWCAEIHLRQALLSAFYVCRTGWHLNISKVALNCQIFTRSLAYSPQYRKRMHMVATFSYSGHPCIQKWHCDSVTCQGKWYGSFYWAYISANSLPLCSKTTFFIFFKKPKITEFRWKHLPCRRPCKSFMFCYIYDW